MVAGSLRRLQVDALDTLRDPDHRTRREPDAGAHGGRAAKRRARRRPNGDGAWCAVTVEPDQT